MPTHAQPVIVSYPEFVSPLKKSVSSRDMFDLKILQSDWSSSFWPNITEKQANRFTAFTFG